MKKTDKLKKIFVRLGSNNDGEVVAAAQAIGNLLRQESKDWHDMAEAIAAFFTEPVERAVPSRRKRKAAA